MEVKKSPQFIREFLVFIRKKLFWTSVGLQALISLLVGALLVVLVGLDPTSALLWIIVGSVFILEMLASLLVFLLTNRPTRDLLLAVINIAGEPSEVAPPNPNDERHVKSGLNLALQKIYEVAGKGGGDKSEQPVTENGAKPSRPSISDLSSALDATTCGFVVMDKNRNIIYHNKSAPIRVDTNGKASLAVLFNGADSLDNWLNECQQKAVHANRIWTRIPDKLPDEDDRRFFDVIASYDKGSEQEVVLSLIDRTSIYIESEEDLDFIAFAAHELRGPITVIRGYLDVLEDELGEKLEADQHELFRRLTVSGNRLSGYINNILNTSRYDRRHLKVHLSEDRVVDIYDTIKDDMALRAKAQNRALAVNIPTDLPTVAADRASISEVFGNLIDNAIKYSNEGGTINVFAKLNGDFVDLSVQDFGIGMPANVMSNLFQKFYRSHRSRETVAGTGIGLYISKAIVESHGGTIRVASEEGRGSTFTVSLPVYATVKDKLNKDGNSNEGLIEHGTGWIKNHNMYRG